MATINLDLISVPFVSIKKYAQLTGDSIRSVQYQISTGQLPIKKRNSDKEKIYINLLKLNEEALNEFE